MKAKWHLLCSAAVFFASSAPALAQSAADPAQDSPLQLNDIVVTAEKRPQRLQETPATITSLSTADLAAARIANVAALPMLVPGLNVSTPYGQGTPPIFTLRGITANDYSFTQSRPVPVYLDEAVRGNTIFEATPLFDVASVDVLKGPQGTLYGKNASGGAISIQSALPTFKTGGYINVGYGNFNDRKAEGAIQAPIVDGILAARVAFTYEKNDGVFKHYAMTQQPDGSWTKRADGRDMAQTDNFAARATLLFTPSDTVDAVLRLNYNHSGGRGISVWLERNDPSVTLFSYPDNGLGFWDSADNVIGRNSIENYGANLQVHIHPASDVTVTSITAVDRGHWTSMLDEDSSPLDMASDVYHGKDAKGFSQEVRVASDYSGPLNYLVGASYTSDSMNFDQTYEYFTDPAFGPGAGFIVGTGVRQKRSGWAGYARLTYELTDRLKLTVGGRHSEDKLKLSNGMTAYDPNPQRGAVANGTFDLTEIVFDNVSRNRDFSNNSFEAVVNYKITPKIMAYASFKQGYRAGAANVQAFESPDEIRIVNPEKVDGYEVGLKTTLLDRRLDFNIAGFYLRYKDQQVLSQDPNFSTRLVLSAVNAKIYGIEAELRAAITRTLQFHGGVTWIDSQYDDGQLVFDQPIGGNQLTGAARWSGSFDADWTMAETGYGAVKANIHGRYTSAIEYLPYQTAISRAPGYFLAGGSIGLEGEHFGVSLWAENIFKKKYFTYYIDQSADFGSVYTNRGYPRTYGVQLSYKF